MCPMPRLRNGNTVGSSSWGYVKTKLCSPILSSMSAYHDYCCPLKWQVVGNVILVLNKPLADKTNKNSGSQSYCWNTRQPAYSLVTRHQAAHEGLFWRCICYHYLPGKVGDRLTKPPLSTRVQDGSRALHECSAPHISSSLSSGSPLSHLLPSL